MLPSLGDVLPNKEEMRNNLKAVGGNPSRNATYSEVVKKYQSELGGGIIDISFDIDCVKYPLEGLDIFLNRNNVLSLKTKSIMMKDVGSLIIKDSISPTLKTDFIGIMASLVDITTSSKNKEKRCDGWIGTIVDSILDFTNESRVERLIKRSMHHALDPTTPTAF